ncbi:universal stress protein [Deinococcus geothermalis]|uniref:universal stress protein n=1 Tax=Deinococcus geothermalis TaxID=68909 RepID=UPI0023523DE4|nr:universal stress protein [Deinococcus geothermalis]
MPDPLIFTAGTGTEANPEPTEPAPDAGSRPFQRIAVGIDFSPASLHALDVARTRFPGARLRLLHVTDARVATTPDLGGGVIPTGPSPALLQTLETADADRLAQLAQGSEETELLVGDPVTGILEAAERWGAELIVVGTHAQGVIEHFLLGSTAEKLISRSPVPVLTVRLPRGQAARR